MKPNRFGFMLVAILMVSAFTCNAGSNVANTEMFIDVDDGSQSFSIECPADFVVEAMPCNDIALISDNSFLVPKNKAVVSVESHKGFGLFATPLCRLARDGISCR